MDSEGEYVADRRKKLGRWAGAIIGCAGVPRRQWIPSAVKMTAKEVSMSRKQRTFTQEFKAEAFRLVEGMGVRRL